MTTDLDMLVMRLREEAQDNPDSLFYQAADEMEKRAETAEILAKACVGSLNPDCTCHKSYLVRNRPDPSCEYCQIGKYILPLANKILGG